MEWQPIETAPAPKGWDDNILLWNGRFVTAGQFDEDEGTWVNSCNCNDTGCSPIEPTHWMPMPDPPAQGIDARSGATACGRDLKGESPIGETDAPR